MVSATGLSEDEISLARIRPNCFTRDEGVGKNQVEGRIALSGRPRASAALTLRAAVLSDH